MGGAFSTLVRSEVEKKNSRGNVKERYNLGDMSTCGRILLF
jgi:hypothetical protein